MHEHICICNSPMDKLHVQINASIFMQRDLVNYSLIVAQVLNSTISHVLL